MPLGKQLKFLAPSGVDVEMRDAKMARQQGSGKEAQS